MKIIGHNNKIVLAGGKALEAGGLSGWQSGNITLSDTRNITLPCEGVCSEFIFWKNGEYPNSTHLFSFYISENGTGGGGGLRKTSSGTFQSVAPTSVTFNNGSITFNTGYANATGDYQYLCR